MGNVFFVRHGEAETNKNDVLSSDYDGYPLTENGRSQVSATAEQLQGIMFDRAYSSPVLRARQSALTFILSPKIGSVKLTVTA